MSVRVKSSMYIMKMLENNKHDDTHDSKDHDTYDDKHDIKHGKMHGSKNWVDGFY